MMTPLYRELSKYVQKDPILSQTGLAATARHDYLGKLHKYLFHNVYKENFVNIENIDRKKLDQQFSVGSENPYSSIRHSTFERKGVNLLAFEDIEHPISAAQVP